MVLAAPSSLKGVGERARLISAHRHQITDEMAEYGQARTKGSNACGRLTRMGAMMGATCVAAKSDQLIRTVRSATRSRELRTHLDLRLSR